MKKPINLLLCLLLISACLCGCNSDTNVSSDSSNVSKSSHTASSKSYNTSKTTTRFTNDYGTPTTKCAHSGCNNYIASSGDTNCCTEHSNRCLECYSYIDEDASYCVSCLKKAASKAKSSTHTCEECGKEADYKITGITGQTEYYCYTHYKEMKKMLDYLNDN